MAAGAAVVGEAGDLARFFEGAWRLQRRIADLHAGTLGRVAGRASFAPSLGGLRYDEQGALTLGTYRGTCAQTYLFAFDDSGGIDVRFRDGRPFHQASLAAGRAETEHDCPPDVYRGRYRIRGPDRWTLTWLARGPRKHALICTSFRREEHREAPKTASV